MLEIKITDPANLSREEANAVILLLSTLADGATLPQAQPATAAPSTAVAEALPTAPAAHEVFSPTPTSADPLPSTTAIAPPPAAPSPAGNLDSRGLPWDGRIHASTRALLQDGSWRQKRGTDPAYVAQVEAELRGAVAAPAAPVAAVPPPPPTVAAAAAPAAPESSAPAVPPAPGGGTTGANPSDPLTFAGLLQRVTAAVAGGKITQAQVVEACGTLGVPSLPVLATRPDLVPSVATLLGL